MCYVERRECYFITPRNTDVGWYFLIGLHSNLCYYLLIIISRHVSCFRVVVLSLWCNTIFSSGEDRLPTISSAIVYIPISSSPDFHSHSVVVKLMSLLHILKHNNYICAYEIVYKICLFFSMLPMVYFQ